MSRLVSRMYGLAPLLFALSFFPVAPLRLVLMSHAPVPMTLLVLGDSLSAGGLQRDPTCANATQDASGVNGWACIFYHHLQGLNPNVAIDNLAVGGTDTCSFAVDTHCYAMSAATAKASMTPAPGSQWDRALKVLRAQPDSVSPITIELGGNDLNAPASVLVGVQQRFDRILQSLRAAAPHATIIVFDVYDPYTSPLPAATRLDAIDQEEAGRVGAVFVDLFAPFAGHEKDYVLPNDTHPTPLGHRVIASTIWDAYLTAVKSRTHLLSAGAHA